MAVKPKIKETKEAYTAAGKVWAPGTRSHGMPLKIGANLKPKPIHPEDKELFAEVEELKKSGWKVLGEMSRSTYEDMSQMLMKKYALKTFDWPSQPTKIVVVGKELELPQKLPAPDEYVPQRPPLPEARPTVVPADVRGTFSAKWKIMPAKQKALIVGGAVTLALVVTYAVSRRSAA